MERYQPDQYGRMMPDAHGQWVSLRAAELTALDAAQKSSADAQATIAALQADNRTYINERHENMKQIEQLQAMNNRLGVIVETLESQLTQRTAELERVRLLIKALPKVEGEVTVRDITALCWASDGTYGSIDCKEQLVSLLQERQKLC